MLYASKGVLYKVWVIRNDFHMPDLMLEIRPATYPNDYLSLCGIYNSISEWHSTPGNLALEHLHRDPNLYFAQFVAEILEDNQKKIVAVAEIGHNTRSHAAGKYWLEVCVHKQYQQRGIGNTLWQTLENAIEARGDATDLQTMINDDEANAVYFVQKHGFTAAWERIESRLDPKTIDLEHYAQLEANLAAAGIRIEVFSSFPEETRIKKLFDLDSELTLDVPFGQPSTLEPFELWHAKFLGNTDVNPDSIWIATKNNQWIGFTSLERQPDYFMIGMTGVQKAFRGMGVAKQLKLQGVRYALEQGGLEIRTFNDHVNTAMLQMNISMGFKRYRSRIRYEKTVKLTQ